MDAAKSTGGSSGPSESSSTINKSDGKAVEVSSGAAQQPANNPIARKLNKILESRVENDKVRFLPFYDVNLSFT